MRRRGGGAWEGWRGSLLKVILRRGDDGAWEGERGADLLWVIFSLGVFWMRDCRGAILMAGESWGF